MIKIITKTPKETQKVAKMLAKEILGLEGRKMALVIALNGELGAGKTTFTQGFVAGLGIKEEISSPTFLIMKKVELREHKIQAKNREPKTNFKNLYHLDCYRLKNEKDLADLGMKEILADPENIVLIEWAERVKKILPKDNIKINFKYKNQKERELELRFNLKDARG